VSLIYWILTRAVLSLDIDDSDEQGAVIFTVEWVDVDAELRRMRVWLDYVGECLRLVNFGQSFWPSTELMSPFLKWNPTTTLHNKHILVQANLIGYLCNVFLIEDLNNFVD
jgi:hypothetical protein